MSFIEKTLLKSLDKNPRNIAFMAILECFDKIMEKVSLAFLDLIAIPESVERREAAERRYDQLKAAIQTDRANAIAHLKDYCEYSDPESKVMELSQSLSKVGLISSIKSEQHRSMYPANVASASHAYVLRIDWEKPMPNTTPIYSGKRGESLDDWLFLINSAFVSSNIPNEKRLVTAVGFLRLGPLHTIKRFINEKRTWESFEAELIRLFGNKGSEDKIKDNLAKLKYTDFSCVEDYINKFLYYLHEINISEVDAIKYFKRSLPENYRMFLALSDVLTVYDAIERVRIIENESDNNKHKAEGKSNYVSKVNVQNKKWSVKTKPKQTIESKPVENVK